MKIVLVGYMGSGKSTIGKLLSKKLNYTLVDLDQYIEDSLKMKIHEIFEQKGELFFRRIEHETLINMLNNSDDTLISLGGGTPCYYNNHELYHHKEGILSIGLTGKISTLFNRLKNEKGNRPLISKLSDEDLKEFIGKHLFERKPYYEKVDKTIAIDEKSAEEISNEILALLA